MRGNGTDTGRPGVVHRTALRAYAVLPRRLRLAVVHAATPSYTLGALCAIENEGHTLVLRQHHRHGWTLPGGLLDRHETPDAAARREVLEETGLQIDPGDPVTVVVDPVERRVDVLFVIVADHRPQATPRSEAVAARWLLPTELGTLDESTSQAFAALHRARSGPARPGRLLGDC
ncbi:MAG: NUDIX hydrolase [Kineosporiaceae bacterium]|nr:NUDIX hydrolase [Kineosporiaceae bacterium]